MRVQLTRPSARHDHGAIAILVAILAVVLFGLAAFATDFGLAYNSKRNLQKGADAAALAAAKEIIVRGGTAASCQSVVDRYNSDSVFAGQVGSAADHYSTENRVNATRQLLEVKCSADNKRVEVVYQAAGSTPRLFGGIFGSGDYATARTAAADIFVPSSGTGLRPYALCVNDLNALRTAGNGWVRVKYPSDDLTLCGEYGGNWYTTDCPLDSNNGTLDENTRDGCLAEVSIIEPIPPATTVTQSQVVAACTGLTSKVPAPCLKANPGNVASNVVVTQWDKLLTYPGISVPVFNKTWKGWADAGSPGCNGPGNNSCYPIQAIAGVKVCGYKWANKDGLDPDNAVPGSPCAGVAADLAAINAVRPRDNNNYLWLKLINVQLTGTSKPSTCSLGSTSCDAGARGTRLVQ